MDHTELVILRGQLLALENMLAHRIMEASEIRQEAAELAKKPGIPVKERRRIELLLTAVDGSDLLQ